MVLINGMNNDINKMNAVVVFVSITSSFYLTRDGPRSRIHRRPEQGLFTHDTDCSGRRPTFIDKHDMVMT